MTVRGALILSLAWGLTGCHTLRARYVVPPVNVPVTYAHTDATARASLDRWWTAFNDPDLDALIEEALKTNADLALAALNVRAARLQVHLAVINPTVAAGYTYEASKPLNSAAPTAQFHSLTASASYEIDLWDQLGAVKDVARWEARATEEDRQAAGLTLIGTAVTLYYEIADANHRITVGEASLTSAERTLELVSVLKAAGGANQLDVVDAEASLTTQRATQAQLIEQRVELRNALTVALNGTPWPQVRERSAVPDDPPPPVASDLPVSLLHRRPDLRAAELRLRESLAQTDAARFSFYPNLSLTGSLGTASTGLAEVISNPLGSVAVALSAPFIQVNQAHFATQLARTQYDESVVRFQKTLLQALYDVDNALSARTQLATEAGDLELSLEAAQTVERLHEVRYRAGGEALQLWLAAQEARRQAELALAGNRLTRLQNHATLCQALGGGTVASEPVASARDD
jgi:NodT family efflux transporter outer membrane factor (OMF) lipoprotein